MRTALLATIAALWIAIGALSPARAEMTEGDVSAIRDVITSQLDAFRRGDGEGAFAFASPSIRAQFGSAEVFMQMVANGYPAVFRPKVVEFMDLSETQRGPQQDVFVVGPDGKPVVARYHLQRQEDGSWKIDGCRLLESEDIAA